MAYERLTDKDWHNEKFYAHRDSDRRVLKRLWDLENKIEQGTLIELPCKIGDTAYHLISANTLEELGVAEIFDGEVTSISKDKDSLWIYCHYNNGLNFWYPKREIGRKLFFTREEAEAKLKELQE